MRHLVVFILYAVCQLSYTFALPYGHDRLPLANKRSLSFFYNQRYRAVDLWDAINEGDLNLFQEILNCGCVYLDEKDENAWTALARAVRVPHEEMALALIEAGADVNTRDNRLFAPLHLACHSQLMNVTLALLQRGADVNAATHLRERPISYALMQDNIPLLELLISYGAGINFVDDHGDTPLHAAAAYGAIENAQFLIDRGANLTVRRGGEETPAEFICACLEFDERELVTCFPDTCTDSDIRQMRRLFRQAEERSSIGVNGGTTDWDLWISVVNGTKEEVEEILSCNCTDPDSGEQIPNCRCVELQAVTQTTTADWDEGQTALHLAVVRKHLAICRLLIENGARADVRNSNGDTPLHLATRNNSTDIVELFLAQEISADGQNNDGRTALHLASRNGFLLIVRLLVDYGASLTLNDEQGATPVEIVCSCLLRRNCREGSCRDGEDIVDLMTALNEEDEDEHQRVVLLFFPPNSATARTDGEASSEEGDGASSLGTFIGVLFGCSFAFFMFFLVCIFVMKGRQAREERLAQLAQTSNQPSASAVNPPRF